MRYVLLLVAFLILSPNRADADHIGIYSDATGSSCNLGAAGFNTTATVVHKFTLGSTGSRFRLEFPPGSSFFSFVSPFVVLGFVPSDGSVGYGTCLQGSIPVGSIVAILTPGTVCVQPANGFANVIVSDCTFVEKAATNGGAAVGAFWDCLACSTIATDQKTWGAVKSLYR